MKSKYYPLAYAVRVQQLLPYISFSEEGELKCVGKVYSCRWALEAAKDPNCKDTYKEDGWALLDKNEEELPPNEYEKLIALIRETKEFIAKKSIELFSPLEGTEEFHTNHFIEKGWIQNQENSIKEAALSDAYMIEGNDNAYRDHDYKK
tara:strand:+ start:134 stop:580 length:447 start_codon:yes stop_codon:yes gene_type:complete